VQTLPPLALSQGVEHTVSLPTGVSGVQLHNASTGFVLLKVQARSTYLAPQTWLTLPLGGQTSSITVTLLDTSSGTLYVTVYMQTDGQVQPGQGPINQQQVGVNTSVVTYNLSKNNPIQEVDGNPVYYFTVPVPSGTLTATVAWYDILSKSTVVATYGVQSGIIYDMSGSPDNTVAFRVFTTPLAPSDRELSFTVTVPPPIENDTMTFEISFSQTVVPIIPQVTPTLLQQPGQNIGQNISSAVPVLLTNTLGNYTPAQFPATNSYTWTVTTGGNLFVTETDIVLRYMSVAWGSGLLLSITAGSYLVFTGYSTGGSIPLDFYVPANTQLSYGTFGHSYSSVTTTLTYYVPGQATF